MTVFLLFLIILQLLSSLVYGLISANWNRMGPFAKQSLINQYDINDATYQDFDKATCAFMCLKKKDECQAYQTDYQSGTSSSSNGTCIVFKWLSVETTTSCINGVCTKENIIHNPAVNTSKLSQSAAYLWVKEGIPMRTTPHFLMIKSDGSIEDISRFSGYSPTITEYPTNPDSNIEARYTAFMMTKDMKLYGYNWNSGNMYTWNFDEQPFKSEGSLATSQRGENTMTYATMNNKIFILGGNDALPIKKNNIIESIQNWGPNYKVEFNIFVKKVAKEEEYLNVFHFTANDNPCCNLGDRIPSVFVHKTILNSENVIQIYSGVNSIGNEVTNIPYNLFTEYNIIIQQYEESQNIWKYEIIINGEVKHSIQNIDPKVFTNVIGYAGYPWDDVFDSDHGTVWNLKINDVPLPTEVTPGLGTVAEVFDGNAWIRMRNLPVLNNLDGGAATFIPGNDDVVYIAGGIPNWLPWPDSPRNLFSNSIWEFNLKTNEVKELSYKIPTEEKSCYENNIDYAGSSDDNIETDDGEKYIVITGTALGCQRSCQELANCQVWTFEISSRRCWRKSRKVERKADSDKKSGQKFCGVRNFGFLGVTLEDNERGLLFVGGFHVGPFGSSAPTNSDSVAILNLDQGTWRTSFDEKFPTVKPFPHKIKSVTLKNVNGAVFAFGGHDGISALDTIYEWNSKNIHWDWSDTSLKIPEATSNPRIIAYNF